MCLYIREYITYTVLRDYEHPGPDGREVLWVKIVPDRLPRGHSCIIIGTVYHTSPPAKDEPLLNYLQDTLSRIESSAPNAGIILAGDFNRVDIVIVKISVPSLPSGQFSNQGQSYVGQNHDQFK